VRARIPVVAVVGALLVGGATTGTTHASWRDQASATSGTVASGAMALSAAASPTGLSVTRGTTGTTLVTISDVSSPQAKNLVQRLTPTLTGTLPAGVSATLTTRSGSSCTSNAQGAVATSPGGSIVTCLNVSVTAGSTASNATVNVSIAGQQLRGGAPVGWAATPHTVAVPVTVTTPTVPSAPVLSCVSASGTQISWTATGTTYHVFESASATTWSPNPLVQGTSATTYTPPNTNGWSQNEVRFYRVVAVNSTGTSSPSNVIKVSRNGNSTNVTCGAP